MGVEKFETLRLEQFSSRMDWLQTVDSGFVGYHPDSGYITGLVQMVSQWKNMGMVMGRPVSTSSRA